MEHKGEKNSEQLERLEAAQALRRMLEVGALLRRVLTEEELLQLAEMQRARIAEAGRTTQK